MLAMIKGQINELSDKNAQAYKLFRQRLESMSFTELVSISSFLQAMEKRIKDRRGEIGDMLDSMIQTGNVENRVLEESDSGKSTRVIMPGFSVQRVVRAPKKEASVGKLRQLMERKGAEEQADNLLTPKKEKLNEKKLEKLLKEHGIDRDEVYDVKSWEVDEQKLKSLAEISQMQDIGFVITDADIETVYEETTGSSYVKCTFEKELKNEVLESLSTDEFEVEQLEENSSDQ